MCACIPLHPFCIPHFLVRFSKKNQITLSKRGMQEGCRGMQGFSSTAILESFHTVNLEGCRRDAEECRIFTDWKSWEIQNFWDRAPELWSRSGASSETQIESLLSPIGYIALFAAIDWYSWLQYIIRCSRLFCSLKYLGNTTMFQNIMMWLQSFVFDWANRYRDLYV